MSLVGRRLSREVNEDRFVDILRQFVEKKVLDQVEVWESLIKTIKDDVDWVVQTVKTWHHMYSQQPTANSQGSRCSNTIKKLFNTCCSPIKEFPTHSYNYHLLHQYTPYMCTCM